VAVTVVTIKARFPEFASLGDDTIAMYLAEAERSHNAGQWGGKSDDGLSYLTAHLLAMFGASGDGCDDPAPGPVTSEREGAVAASYAVSDEAKQSEFGSTKYGRRYLELRRTIFVTRCI